VIECETEDEARMEEALKDVSRLMGIAKTTLDAGFLEWM
jgi:hypothetical protein